MAGPPMNDRLFTPRVLLAAGFVFVSLFATSAFAQKDVSIAEVQGDKAKSPYEGQQVKLRGIVTARNRNGIFVQTPEDKADKDPATSEGIYVYIGQNGSFTGDI